MKHAVKWIHFVGMVDPSREQGSRLREATVGEGRRMPKALKLAGEGMS